MNYNRFLTRREQEHNLELIAGLLDIEPLETVTSAEGPLRRETIECVKPNVLFLLSYLYLKSVCVVSILIAKSL